MYLFILGCAGSSLLCGLFSSYAEEWLLFCYGAQVLGYTGFHSCGFWALEHRFSSCGTWAWLLHGMWHLHGPGVKPMSPALAADSLLMSPQGSPVNDFLN